MLVDINTRESIDRIPHSREYDCRFLYRFSNHCPKKSWGGGLYREYDVWKSRLSQLDRTAFGTIFNELNRRVSGSKVNTSSWIPGRDWRGTVFQPIYDACQDQENAAKFFGLILWEVMKKRDEAWSFGKYEKDGIPIKGLTYFRVCV